MAMSVPMRGVETAKDIKQVEIYYGDKKTWESLYKELPISAPARVFEEYGGIALIFVIPTLLRKLKSRKREMKAISFFLGDFTDCRNQSEANLFHQKKKKNEDQGKLTITDL